MGSRDTGRLIGKSACKECLVWLHRQRLMWSKAIVLVFPCPQGWLSARQGEHSVVALPEFLPTGAVESFHTAIELA